MANLISLNDAKQQLIALARHFKAIAEIEEREARRTTLIQNPHPDQ